MCGIALPKNAASNLRLDSDDGHLIRLGIAGEMTGDYGEYHDVLEELVGIEAMSRPVLLDMAEVDFISTAGISWLLVCHKRLKECGGRFVLYNVPPMILQPLEFMKLTKVLTIARSEAVARSMACGATNE